MLDAGCARLVTLGGNRTVSFLIEAEDNPPAVNEDRTPDEVRILRHEPDGLVSRRGVRLHVELPVQVVTWIEKLPVIPFPDQLFQLGWAQALTEVNFVKVGRLVAKETLALRQVVQVGLR